MSSKGDKSRHGISRRQFLAKGPLGLAGMIALGFFTGRTVVSALRGSRRLSTFAKGSIFTPSKDSLRRRS